MTSRRGRSTPIGTAVIQELQSKVEHLRGRVAVLEEEVGSLKASPQEEIIVLRTVSKEQAKQEIRELFQPGETLFYSDIAQRLRLELPVVGSFARSLKRKGRLRSVTTLFEPGDALRGDRVAINARRIDQPPRDRGKWSA